MSRRIAVISGRGVLHRALLIGALCGVMVISPPANAAETWVTAPPMGTARAYHTATLLRDGTVLVTGGDDGSIAGSAATGPRKLASAERYDPATGRWRPAAPMPVAHTYHTAVSLPDGRVFVVGDYNTLDAVMAELYDPVADRWTLAAASPAKYGTAGAALLPNGQVLVVACAPQRYDPATDRYAPTGRPTTAGVCTSGSAVTSLADGRVLVTGGPFRGGGYNSAEIYDPKTDQWTQVASMHGGRAFHTATLLPDGQVLVVGGADLPGTLATAERYDPTNDRWTAVAPLPVARSDHTATLLPDGRVLVVGGVGDRGDTGPATAAILYDPKTDQWSDAGTTMTTTGGHTATLLPDGSVLVTGGDDLVSGQNRPTPNAERYTASILRTDLSHRVSIIGTVLIVGAGIIVMAGFLIRQRRVNARGNERSCIRH